MAILPENHYWLVGNKADQVFAGPDAAYVDLDNAGYVAFLAGNGIATNILSDGELADVLTKYGAAPSLIAAAGWTDWGGVPAADILAVLLTVGVDVSSTGTPAIDAVYECAPARQNLITAEALYIQTTGGPGVGTFSNGTGTRGWPDITGTPHLFDTTLFVHFAQAVARRVDEVHYYVATGASGMPPAASVTIA